MVGCLGGAVKSAADIIEDAEIELDRIVMVFHHSGLNYFQILKMFLVRCVSLMTQSEAEYFIKGGN